MNHQMGFALKICGLFRGRGYKMLDSESSILEHIFIRGTQSILVNIFIRILLFERHIQITQHRNLSFF